MSHWDTNSRTIMVKQIRIQNVYTCKRTVRMYSAWLFSSTKIVLPPVFGLFYSIHLKLIFCQMLKISNIAILFWLYFSGKLYSIMRKGEGGLKSTYWKYLPDL